MRIAIAAFATALMITGAAAQGQTPPNPGSAFCIKDGAKNDCSYATMAACQQALKEKSSSSGEKATCAPRGQ